MDDKLHCALKGYGRQYQCFSIQYSGNKIRHVTYLGIVMKMYVIFLLYQHSLSLCDSM